MLWPTISIREFDTGRVNLDPPMMCADWPVAGNLTLFQSQTIGKLKPRHRCHGLSFNLKPSGTPIECVSELSLHHAGRV